MQLFSISYLIMQTDPMYAKSRAVSLVEENKLTLFHAYRYHEGHTATNLDQWKGKQSYSFIHKGA